MGDLAIGVSSEDLVDSHDAGAVTVLYGSVEDGLSTDHRPDQFWTQDSPGVEGRSEGESFGRAVAAGDFEGDGVDDLAIGAPNDDVATRREAGVVNLLYGSVEDGLSADRHRADQLWSQNSPLVHNQAERDEGFGSSLTAGDFNGDGISDLAIGVPYEDLGIESWAGAVNVIYGSLTDGLSPTAVLPDQFWHQDARHVRGVAEFDDRFGYSLATGDFNADGFADLAIGVPYESRRGSREEAGVAQVVYGSGSDGLSVDRSLAAQFWNQGVDGVEDTVEYSDWFSYSLVGGDFNGDEVSDLAIGVRGEMVLSDLGPVR